MEAHLRAGVAIYNDGGYHAAHDAWEDHWLDLETGSDDEQFLHGLIQFTAAVHHARDGNWSGATGLAESGREYLRAVSASYREVNVGDVRRYLTALEADPERIERAAPLALTHRGEVLAPSDLGFEATAVAAAVLAEANGYEEEPIERAAAYGGADLTTERTASPFVTLLFDFVREPADREIVYQRLSEHVDLRSQQENDVEGLFDRRE
jgi:predicted metal-dependent hydrolase